LKLAGASTALFAFASSIAALDFVVMAGLSSIPLSKNNTGKQPKATNDARVPFLAFEGEDDMDELEERDLGDDM
jgi:hypothetical protein